MTYAIPRPGNIALDGRRTFVRGRRKTTGIKRFILGCVLFIITLLSMVGTKWALAGVPVRAVAAGGTLVVIAILMPYSFGSALKRSRSTIFILAIFGIWGGLLGIANESPFGDVISQLIEIHVQAAINFLLAYVIAERIGVKRAVAIFVTCVICSALIASAQAIGLEWAWNVRLWIAKLVGEDLLSDYYYRYQRPMGLALSPVRLGLQLCLALAAYLITMSSPYKGFTKLDLRPFYACVIFAIGAISGENRSPLLGCLIFLIIYISIVKPRYIPALIAASAVIIPLGLKYVDSLDGVRIADIGDDSSRGRLTFLVYGTLLFVSRPIGYGLNFDPRDYWPLFWDAVQWTPVPGVIRIFELHNYPLTMLNMYGAALLLFIPFVLKLVKRYAIAAISLVPYFIHIFFHNDGPMWTDYLIWFIFAYAVVARDEAEDAASESDYSHPKLERKGALR